MVNPHGKISSYESYLRYKHIIDVFREKNCTRQDVADALGIDVTNTWHVIRVLVKGKIIKRVRYEIDTGGKKAVYKLVKDD